MAHQRICFFVSKIFVYPFAASEFLPFTGETMKTAGIDFAERHDWSFALTIFASVFFGFFAHSFYLSVCRDTPNKSMNARRDRRVVWLSSWTGRARVISIVRCFVFKNTKRRLVWNQSKHAPRFPPSCAKGNGVVKLETHLTIQWTWARNSDFVIALSVEPKVAWIRFRPTSSQPFGASRKYRGCVIVRSFYENFTYNFAHNFLE